jgi:hypothetical protein
MDCVNRYGTVSPRLIRFPPLGKGVSACDQGKAITKSISNITPFWQRLKLIAAEMALFLKNLDSQD